MADIKVSPPSSKPPVVAARIVVNAVARTRAPKEENMERGNENQGRGKKLKTMESERSDHEAVLRKQAHTTLLAWYS